MQYEPQYVSVAGLTDSLHDGFGSFERSGATAHDHQAPPYYGQADADDDWRAPRPEQQQQQQQRQQRQQPQRQQYQQPAEPKPAEGKPEENTRFRAQFLKSQLCRYYKTGCLRGDQCAFAHGHEELQGAPDLTKTSLCKAFLAGACPHRAEDCQFAHGNNDLRVTRAYLKSAPCKLFTKGLCKLGDNCRHAHTIAEIRDTKEVVARKRGLGQMYRIATGDRQHVEQAVPYAQLPEHAGQRNGQGSLAGMLRSFPMPPPDAMAIRATPGLVEKAEAAGGGHSDASSTTGSFGDAQEIHDQIDFVEGNWEGSNASGANSPLNRADATLPALLSL